MTSFTHILYSNIFKAIGEVMNFDNIYICIYINTCISYTLSHGLLEYLILIGQAHPGIGLIWVFKAGAFGLSAFRKLTFSIYNFLCDI